MAANAGTLESIARHVGLALQPLQDLFAPENVTQLFAELGLQFPPALLQPAFKTALNNGATAAGALPNLITQLSNAVEAGDDVAILQGGEQLIQQISVTINSFTQVSAELQNLSASLPGMDPAEVTVFAQSLASRILGHLIISYLEEVQPAIIGAGNLLGFIDYVPNPGVPGNPTHPPHTLRKLNLSKLGNVLTKPLDVLRDVYGWGEPGFDGTQLILRLNTSLDLLGFPSQLNSPTSLTTSLFTLQATPPGLTGLLTDEFFSNVDFTLPLSNIWSLQIHMAGTFTPGISATINPPADFTLKPPALTLNGQLFTGLEAKGPDANHPLIVFGQIGGSRIQADSFLFSVGLNVTWDPVAGAANAEPQISLQVKGGKVIIDTTKADGFLATLLGNVHVEAGCEFKVTWQPDTGVHFEGGAQLEIDLPLHVNLGPVTLSTLYLVLGASDSGFPIEISVALGLKLGPIQASVDRLGVKGLLSFPDHGGNLGPANLSLGFKPPNGVGLSVDAGIVKGGGYLYFDFDKEEYAGVLELSIAEIVTVKAIGLITTRMPDGSKGFSLLIIITAEFGTGIQLGFGFTLLGVGGLLGLNRTMLLEPIASGIRTGAINSIVFPPDPVANAPRIISDLRMYFPPYEGKFLIGPMVKLGWGTPTLVSLAFGIIIEIPGNVAIVGVLRIVLPEEHAPIIVINVAFIGALEFDKSRIWFFAAMFDSRILFMTMEGEMGLLMDYSEHPDFVLSVGGFHPQFNPPPLPFPNPRRIHIDVLRTPLARITVENYFAVTSNTVQFGARAEMFYGVSAFNLHGNFSFDALFQFSPFHFLIDISFSIGMDVFGVGVFSVSLKLKLSGPAPWQARGTATLSIDLWLFSIDISVDFDITWGDANNPKLPSIDALPVLVAEFNKADNWRAALPASANLLVSLRVLDETTEKLVLHPVGTLRISQRAIPLGIHVDKMGANPIADAHLFSVQANVANLAATSQPPQENFAIAQFQNLSDAEKLSRPSFQDIDGGVELAFAGRQLGSGKVVKRVVRYEVKIIDGDDKYHAFRWFKNVGTLFFHWLHGAAITQSTLSYAHKKNLVPTMGDERVKVGQPGFVVAGTHDNKALATTPVFRSEAHARDYLNAQLSKNPGQAEDIHVIPAFEATA